MPRPEAPPLRYRRPPKAVVRRSLSPASASTRSWSMTCSSVPASSDSSGWRRPRAATRVGSGTERTVATRGRQPARDGPATQLTGPAVSTLGVPPPIAPLRLFSATSGPHRPTSHPRRRSDLRLQLHRLHASTMNAPPSVSTRRVRLDRVPHPARLRPVGTRLPAPRFRRRARCATPPHHPLKSLVRRPGRRARASSDHVMQNAVFS